MSRSAAGTGALVLILGIATVGVALVARPTAPTASRPTPTATPSVAPELSAPPTPSSPAPASTTAAPTASPTPPATPSAGPFEVDWSPVGIPAVSPAVEAILHVDDRLIIAGRDGLGAAVWFSDDDGVSWQPGSIASTRDDDERTSFGDVVAVDDTLIGVGWWGFTESDQFAWMTWRSTDGGLTWAEHRDESQWYAMRTATVHDGTVIGVGWTYAGTTPFDSWIATSDDGESWQRIDPESMRWSAVDAIASTGDGLVAVGSTWDSELSISSTARAWLSADDGATWRAIELEGFDGAPYSSARDVVVREDGSIVAVGASTDGRSDVIPTAWTSVDGGQSWRVENMGAAGSADAVAELDVGLVAIGRLGDSEHVPTYSSGDGLLWMRTRDVGDREIGRPLVIANDGSRIFAGFSCAFSDPCPQPLFVGTPRVPAQ